MSECNTITSFLRMLQNLIPYDDPNYEYCFRGQAVSNWEISSSLSRKNLSSEEAKKRIYEEVIRNFPKEFSKVDELTFNDLAKMQHLAIPTDLIDVCFNPLVSLFFATEKGKGKKGVQSGIVYIFKIPKGAVEYTGNSRVFEAGRENKLRLLKTDFSNERIKRQNGAFIYIPQRDVTELRKYIIHSVTISNKSKKTIRKELLRLGISHKTLFPELSEFYREIENLIQK